MDYRGTKSVKIGPVQIRDWLNHGGHFTVKAQRRDGIYINLKSNDLFLRCCLTGFEKNHQVKILSKQKICFTQTRFYSTNKPKTLLSPTISLDP